MCYAPAITHCPHHPSQNQKGSWQFIHDQGNFTIPQPVLSILPESVRSYSPSCL